ncbi:hypothetical protein DID78_06180, partial [Candidatus Marinamargulisbacteria bacterium SCGC AG-343-D04]
MKFLLLSILMSLMFCIQGCSSLGDSSENTATSKTTVTENPEAEIFIHGDSRREYILYVPSSYDGSVRMPLLFNFHGNGGNATEYCNLTNMTSLAENNNVILVCPQGLVGGSGTSEWNAYVGEDNKSSTDDFGFVESLVSHLSSEYSVDSNRVYAVGYSNGGFMSYGLACHKSSLFAAVGSISGTMIGDLSTCNPSHPFGVITFHGTSDFVVPYNGGVPGFASVANVIDFWVDFNHLSEDSVSTSLNDRGRTV